MRNFRMEKLAEFKKLADDAGSSEDTEFPLVESGEDKDSYVYNAQGSGSSQSAEDLKEEYDKQTAAATSGTGTATPKPAAKPKPKPVLHTDVIANTHWGKTLTDRAGYTYTISGDGKSLSYKKGDSKEVKLNQYYKNWKAVVANINALPITPAPAATSATTSAPAAAAATTQAANPTKAYDSKETILGQVLQKMYDDKLAGTPGPDLVREKRRVKIIMDGIGGGPETGRTYAGAAARVILNQKTGLGETIPASYSEAISNISFLDSLQQAINGLYDSAFRWSRAQKDANHVGFWRRLGGRTVDSKSATTIVSNYINKGLRFSYQNPAITPAEAPAPPAAPVATPAPVTPAPAVSPADDGHSKGASLNKKFIKAATLRRLKIRSQMEAAIDSSAQMGRARVY